MKLDRIPEQGIMYALYTDRAVFQRYRRNDLPEEEELKSSLLELHLFDDQREYRYIKTRKDEIETEVCDDSTLYDERYTEKIYTSGAADISCVEVINYITYDENDLMRIDNYRLKEVK